MSKDRNVLLISVSVFLSYLPEAGQYSCFFVYLRLVSHQLDVQYESLLVAGELASLQQVFKAIVIINQYKSTLLMEILAFCTQHLLM